MDLKLTIAAVVIAFGVSALIARIDLRGGKSAPSVVTPDPGIPATGADLPQGGKLLAPPIALGPLGSTAFGPHDIAWSPAGYMVIALGELQDQSYTFKVQAFKPDSPEPLWTFTPNQKQGLQIAYAVAVDPYGKVCAGGIGKGSYPAFTCMGS